MKIAIAGAEYVGLFIGVLQSQQHEILKHTAFSRFDLGRDV